MTDTLDRQAFLVWLIMSLRSPVSNTLENLAEVIAWSEERTEESLIHLMVSGDVEKVERRGKTLYILTRKGIVDGPEPA